MKLLIAVQSKDIKLVYKSLRWLGRTGYDLRIFIGGYDWEPYIDRLKDVNMNHYVLLTEKNLVVDVEPMVYAEANGYSLIIEVLEHRAAFSMKRKGIELDKEVENFVRAVGEARVKLGESPELDSVTLRKGITMRRVHHGKVKEQSTS